MVKISLNNETREVEKATVLSTVIERWQYGGQKIAVAVNGEFIPRSAYHQTALDEGDHIDIVKPVGGG